MKSVEDIDQKGLCIGCGICQSIAGNNNISLSFGKDGFFHPEIKGDGNKQWNIIKSVCPGIEVKLDTQCSSKYEKLWGPFKNIFLGSACDEQLRWKASSGGGLSAILISLLEKRIVSKIVQTGTNPANPLENITVVSTNTTDVSNCAGSRYSPSTPLINIKKILHECEDKIVFVGRPCDISAIKSYLKIFPEEKKKVYMLISFFCAGTPSFCATENLLEKMGAPKNNLKDFWYRGRGWPGKSTAIDSNNKQYSMLYQQSWGKILNTKLHFRCKICADGIGSLADLVFADGWEIKNGCPCFEEKDGQNLIISRTENGDKILQDAIENNYIKIKQIEINKIQLIQPSQFYKKKIIGARIMALRMTGLVYPKFKGFNIIHNSLRVNPIVFLKNLLGSLYRRFKQIRKMNN